LELREDELIAACKKNKRKARNKLYNLYANKLLGICLRYTRNLSEAEDVLHDSFIKIFTKIDQYSGKGNFEAWMKRITANTAIQHLRDKAKENAFFSGDKVDEINIAEETEDVSIQIPAQELLKMIQELPDGYKMVFNLYVFEEMGHKEIAALLDISEGTSKSQYYRAKQYLQNEITNHIQKLNKE
jgi:RNA polymerase sigma-70 factor (ECF subfamily)